MEFVRGANALTARWAREACRGRTGALSGASVWPLLALLAAAARGKGRAELQTAAGVAAEGAERHARELLDVLVSSTAADGALGVWNRAGLPLEPWWLGVVPEAARGELAGDATVAQARLDDWVRRRTGGRLTRMPVQVRPDTLLVLATALSIDTRWREPFDNVPLRPQEGPWAGRPRETAGLSRRTGDVDDLALAQTPGGPLTLLAVRSEDDVDVHLCLGEPARPAGEVLAGAIEALDGRHPLHPGTALLGRGTDRPAPGVRLHKINAFTSRTMLSVTTARFEVKAEHDLLDRAGLFGLATVSTDDPRGHFPGISRAPLKVNRAAQDITATFSAEGFKAAAVTAFSIAPGGMPRSEAYLVAARFDRPFGFLARHRPSGLVLLAGWVAEPQDWPDDVPATPW
ncbi:serpin family protein [Spirillospora sp. CA-255316]